MAKQGQTYVHSSRSLLDWAHTGLQRASSRRPDSTRDSHLLVCQLERETAHCISRRFRERNRHVITL